MKMLDETPGMARAASGHPGGGGGNGALIAVGVLVLLGSAGGILWWVSKRDAQPPTPTATVPSTSVSAPPPESTVELPPLPKDEPDAGPDAPEDAAEVGPKVANGGGGGGGGLCGGPCKGTVSTELRNFISGRGAAAKTCYRSALEAQDTLAGDITVSVRISSDGSLCSVGVLSDTVGNAALASCVKQKMQTKYPAPTGGCVDQQVKVNFKPQK